MLLRFVAVLLSTIVLTSCTFNKDNGPGTVFDILNGLKVTDEELRGVWISYLDLQPILNGDFKESLDKMFYNCTSLGINTVFVQVRPFADSLYSSKLFPKSELLKEEYDPLKIMVLKAKKYNLKIHAWINPMRGPYINDIEKISDDFSIRKWYDDSSLRAKNLIEYEERIYLNPASDEVRELITNGALEILENYEVDGIHIDDYFYPSLLPKSYDNCDDEMRRENTDKMVKELYAAVKKFDFSKIFSVSPTGNIHYNYNNIYTDVKKWCAEDGYCDIIIPQLYYGFEHKTLDYNKALKEWSELVTSENVDLVVGLSPYKVGQEDAFAGNDEWKKSDDIISRQILKSREYENCKGVVFFRYESLFLPGDAAKDIIEKEKERITYIFKKGREDV